MTTEVRQAGLKGAIKRLLIGTYAEWQIEPAMRYMPIVREIRRRGCEDRVTEIGSGSIGIVPYLGYPVTGVDMSFDEPGNPLLERMEASVLDLPFEDASLPCVVSTDMLEHVPPLERQKAVDELLRVTRDLLVLAVPAGQGAERQDRDLDRLYIEEHGQAFPFLTEHVENGLPDMAELERLVGRGLAATGRPGRVSFAANGNLRVRAAVMRVWIRSHRPAYHWAWVALNHLHPLLSRLNFGRCYRVMAVVDFSAD